MESTLLRTLKTNERKHALDSAEWRTMDTHFWHLINKVLEFHDQTQVHNQRRCFTDTKTCQFCPYFTFGFITWLLTTERGSVGVNVPACWRLISSFRTCPYTGDTWLYGFSLYPVPPLSASTNTGKHNQVSRFHGPHFSGAQHLAVGRSAWAFTSAPCARTCFQIQEWIMKISRPTGGKLTVPKWALPFGN